MPPRPTLDPDVSEDAGADVLEDVENPRRRRHPGRARRQAALVTLPRTCSAVCRFAWGGGVGGLRVPAGGADCPRGFGCCSSAARATASRPPCSRPASTSTARWAARAARAATARATSATLSAAAAGLAAPTPTARRRAASSPPGAATGPTATRSGCSRAPTARFAGASSTARAASACRTPPRPSAGCARRSAAEARSAAWGAWRARRGPRWRHRARLRAGERGDPLRRRGVHGRRRVPQRPVRGWRLPQRVLPGRGLRARAPLHARGDDLRGDDALLRAAAELGPSARSAGPRARGRA